MEIIRRHRIEIFYEMLSVTKETAGIKKTKMFWKSNLNHTMGSTYLNILLNREVIEETNGYYFITEKGRRWIERYGELIEW